MGNNSKENQTPPYHAESGKYTKREIYGLVAFAEEEFPHFYLPKGFRDSTFKIEIPNVSWSGRFTYAALSVLPDELQSCHPRLKRTNVVVRFVQELEERQDFEGKKGAAAVINEISIKNEKKLYLIRVVPEDTGNDDERVSTTLFRIIHEIAEEDYFLKSPKGTRDLMKFIGTPDYEYTEDEEVANRRAFRAVKKIYPTLEWRTASYPQDR